MLAGMFELKSMKTQTLKIVYLQYILLGFLHQNNQLFADKEE